MTRKRKHISLTTKLAASLSLLLPQEVLNEARRRKLSAEEILAVFDFDHIQLHSLGGSDEWWNLHPLLRAAHRLKSRGDTTIAAKVKRVSRKELEHKQKMQAKLLPAPTFKERPKQKIASRGFQKKPKTTTNSPIRLRRAK